MGNGNTQSRAGSAFGIVCDYIKNFNVELLSRVPKMVPIRREAKRPKAMAPKASIR